MEIKETVEVIMQVDFACADAIHIVAHAKKVQELIRCKDCIFHGEFDEFDYCVCEITG